MYEVILGFQIGILIIVFFNLFISQKDLKNLHNKQQSTIYGVSHLWGSMMELKEEMQKVTEKTKEVMSEEEIDEVVE